MEGFKVYVIHSEKSINDIIKMLNDCGGYVYIGIIYKSYSRQDKKETKKTIVFCPETTIKNLEKKYSVFNNRIAPYNWDSFPLPKEEKDETWNLHISGVPNDYTVSDAENFVIRQLQCILPRVEGEVENYTVTFTPRSRETGEIHGFGKIQFAESVSKDTIKLCKLILHNTPVQFKNSPETRMVTCVWYRVPKTRTRDDEESVDDTYEEQNEPRDASVTKYSPASKRMSTVSVQRIDGNYEGRRYSERRYNSHGRANSDSSNNKLDSVRMGERVYRSNNDRSYGNRSSRRDEGYREEYRSRARNYYRADD